MKGYSYSDRARVVADWNNIRNGRSYEQLNPFIERNRKTLNELCGGNLPDDFKFVCPTEKRYQTGEGVGAIIEMCVNACLETHKKERATLIKELPRRIEELCSTVDKNVLEELLKLDLKDPVTIGGVPLKTAVENIKYIETDDDDDGLVHPNKQAKSFFYYQVFLNCKTAKLITVDETDKNLLSATYKNSDMIYLDTKSNKK